MRIHHRLFPMAAALAALTGRGPAAEPQAALVRDGDRIVFVGDSITGQGGLNRQGGFVHLVKAALDATRPGSHVSVVPLGGSGQGVGSWSSVEKRSRDQESFLDVKDVPVKASLDQPASILIVMLGMNDSLSPYISPDAAGIDKWQEQYRQLLAALRARCQPRVLALATVTPNTEDPESPKNLALAEMNRRLPALAKEAGGVVLPVAETLFATLAEGRRCRPDFHVTGDFVHPNGVGQAAIAVGMLRGLGESAAAEWVTAKVIEPALSQARGPLPALSYTLRPLALPVDAETVSFEIACYWTPAAPGGPVVATLAPPPGWTVAPAEGPVPAGGPAARFTVTGKPDRLRQVFQLQAGDGRDRRAAEIAIPAPWLIGSGFANAEVWERPKFSYAPAKGVLPGEDRLAQGLDFGQTPAGWKGAPPQWRKYVASVDYNGGPGPGNVCLYAVSFAKTFEAAFGVRWLHSDAELPLKLVLGKNTFAGDMGLCVWLNGESVYAGAITAEPRAKAERDIRLRRGWNALVFKANHCTWQWQYTLDLQAADPAALAALRVATLPPPAE